jgi:hypothetical protein
LQPAYGGQEIRKRKLATHGRRELVFPDLLPADRAKRGAASAA